MKKTSHGRPTNCFLRGSTIFTALKFFGKIKRERGRECGNTVKIISFGPKAVYLAGDSDVGWLDHQVKRLVVFILLSFVSRKTENGNRQEPIQKRSSLWKFQALGNRTFVRCFDNWEREFFFFFHSMLVDISNIVGNIFLENWNCSDEK